MAQAQAVITTEVERVNGEQVTTELAGPSSLRLQRPTRVASRGPVTICEARTTPI